MRGWEVYRVQRKFPTKFGQVHPLFHGCCYSKNTRAVNGHNLRNTMKIFSINPATDP